MYCGFPIWLNNDEIIFAETDLRKKVNIKKHNFSQKK